MTAKERKITKELRSKMEQSRTSTFKTVFPKATNRHDTLFGGTALQWIDEVASIAATRFCRQEVSTVSLDRTDFNKPIPSGSIVELIAQVFTVGTTSLKVRVEVYIEKMYSNERVKAIESLVTFVAVKNGKPVPVKI
jgi:acyl-CoA hydrolase